MIKDMASKFTEEELEQIGNYLAEKYPVLKSGSELYRYSDIKIDIHERIVRVEEELKHQRELIYEVLKMMEKRFEEAQAYNEKKFQQVDKRLDEMHFYNEKRFEQIDTRLEKMKEYNEKRFEQVDKRFEQVDRRFEEMRTDMNSRFEQVRADMNSRFEQVDKRFSMMMWFTGIGFTLVTTIITGAFVLLK